MPSVSIVFRSTEDQPIGLSSEVLQRCRLDIPESGWVIVTDPQTSRKFFIPQASIRYIRQGPDDDLLPPAPVTEVTPRKRFQGPSEA